MIWKNVRLASAHIVGPIYGSEHFVFTMHCSRIFMSVFIICYLIFVTQYIATWLSSSTFSYVNLLLHFLNEFISTHFKYFKNLALIPKFYSFQYLHMQYVISSICFFYLFYSGFLYIMVLGCFQLCYFQQGSCSKSQHWWTRLYG